MLPNQLLAHPNLTERSLTSSPMASPGKIARSSEAQPAQYVDVQRGYPLIALLTLTSLATLALSWGAGPHIATRLILLPQFAFIACFHTLLIRVKDGYLTWQFGPGWIRGQVLLSEIVSTDIVLSPFAYGWGFRRTVRGWRFYRGGALAIEVHCRGGRHLRLGTSRAHELQHLIGTINGHRQQP